MLLQWRLLSHKCCCDRITARHYSLTSTALRANLSQPETFYGLRADSSQVKASRCPHTHAIALQLVLLKIPEMVGVSNWPATSAVTGLLVLQYEDRAHEHELPSDRGIGRIPSDKNSPVGEAVLKYAARMYNIAGTVDEPRVREGIEAEIFEACGNSQVAATACEIVTVSSGSLVAATETSGRALFFRIITSLFTLAHRVPAVGRIVKKVHRKYNRAAMESCCRGALRDSQLKIHQL
jgi:hypothetical protein